MADGAMNLIHGSALDMVESVSDSVTLVFTSLPFFDDETEQRLQAPIREQLHFDEVSAATLGYALTFRKAFAEMRRVLRPGGHLVLETKDLRYGECLIPLSAVHRTMAEAAGFLMTDAIRWEALNEAPHHGSRWRQQQRLESGRPLRTIDTEEFQVFVDPDGPELAGVAEDFSGPEIEELVSSFWRTGQSRSWHPHPTPRAVIERFVRLFTRPGDLVLDPFAGSGQVLRTAVHLKRAAAGYEIDRARWARALGVDS